MSECLGWVWILLWIWMGMVNFSLLILRSWLFWLLNEVLVLLFVVVLVMWIISWWCWRLSDLEIGVCVGLLIELWESFFWMCCVVFGYICERLFCGLICLVDLFIFRSFLLIWLVRVLWCVRFFWLCGGRENMVRVVWC